MRWVNNFQETGSVKDLPRSGRPGVSQQTVENVQVAFQRSPQKSIRRASRELHVPKSTIHKVLHKRLQLHPYKVQIIQQLQPNDLPIRYEFATTMLNKIEGDNEYLQKVMFSDECTFFVSGHVNRHNVRIWGTENPRSIREHIRGSPKVNVWCALMHNKVVGRFFFAENTIRGIIYCDMIQEYLLPRVEEMQPPYCSNKTAHLHIGQMMVDNFWIHIFLVDGLAVADQSLGHLALLTLHPWIFSFGGMSRVVFTKPLFKIW